MHILLVNSAHGKYPVGSEGWVQTTGNVVRELAVNSPVFVCSTDPFPWNLVTYLAGVSGAHMQLIVKTPAGDQGFVEFSRLVEEFALDRNRVVPAFFEDAPPFPAHPKDSWQIRDRLAFAVADEIYPVSIRPEGRLERLMSEPEFRDKIRNDFRIPWSPCGFIPRYTLTGRPWRPLPGGEWLVHWTRACQGKWPGEAMHEFFRDLLANGTLYVRAAAETLRRIITEGRIRGSSWKVPGGAAAVAFTSLSPGDTLELMRWRKRYAHLSFEPYGVAIVKKELVTRGAREVRYVRDGEERYGRDLFTHAAGEGDRWTRECEWRLPGDLDLNSLPPHTFTAIVPDEHAARELREHIRRDVPIHVLFK
jgi:hypothetical protein